MLITIGKIIKTWGVQGELRIEPMTDFPERFEKLTRVYLVSPQGREITGRVQSVRYRGGIPYLVFQEFTTPEKARELNGWFIKIPEQEAMPLPDGRYYWFELIGMEVYSESGEKLGVIAEIFETGSNDVYVMKSGRREIYIPATREVIKHVDRETGRIVIHVMKGLMD